MNIKGKNKSYWCYIAKYRLLLHWGGLSRKGEVPEGHEMYCQWTAWMKWSVINKMHVKQKNLPAASTCSKILCWTRIRPVRLSNFRLWDVKIRRTKIFMINKITMTQAMQIIQKLSVSRWNLRWKQIKITLRIFQSQEPFKFRINPTLQNLRGK